MKIDPFFCSYLDFAEQKMQLDHQPMVVIERVYTHQLKQFNTANYPRESIDDVATSEEIKQAIRKENDNQDYVIEVDKTSLHKYMYLVDYPVAWTYEFTAEEVQILMLYARVGSLSGRVPRSPDGSAFDNREDLNQVARRLSESWKEGEWFYRFTRASPKDGLRAFPGTDAKTVIAAIATSKRALQALENGNKILYFVPFRTDWHVDNEFRVFIRNRIITAVSQYSPYHSNLAHLEDADLLQKLTLIVPFCYEVLRKISLTNIRDCTIDVLVSNAALPEAKIGKCELIELNTFGYWLAAGASLFDWLTDFNKLYGLTSQNAIYFRIANPATQGTYDPFLQALEKI